jgi:hypothetical protein
MKELADYLERTPVAGYAQLLHTGIAIASNVEIPSRASLRETWSIFGNLGGIDAPQVVERAKFLVSEVRGILERPDCTDARSRQRLTELLDAVQGGRLVDRRITLALTDGGTVIVDGNKRAAAIYELASDAVALPAFLIESAPGFRPLSLP